MNVAADIKNIASNKNVTLNSTFINPSIATIIARINIVKDHPTECLIAFAIF